MRFPIRKLTRNEVLTVKMMIFYREVPTAIRLHVSFEIVYPVSSVFYESQ